MQFISLVAIFVIFCSISSSDAYFGTTRVAREQADIEATIVSISKKIKSYDDAYNYIKDLVNADTSSGFNIYRDVLKMVFDYTEVMNKFIQSLKYYASSQEVTAQQIITSAESLINQMIAKDTIRQAIKDEVKKGGGKWPIELAVADTVFDDIANDLKTILGALLVICNSQSSVENQKEADKTLLDKLKALDESLGKFSTLYTYLQKMIDFIKSKLTKYNTAKGDFNDIFKDIIANYESIVTSDYNRIFNKNEFFSKGFYSLAREKQNYVRNEIVIDTVDKFLTIRGTDYNFAKDFLKDLKTPTEFKKNLELAQAEMAASIDLIEGSIKRAGERMIIKLFTLAKGDSIERIYNCIMASNLPTEFDEFISADMDGIRALVTVKYFDVKAFSNKFVDSFDEATRTIAKAINTESNMNGIIATLSTKITQNRPPALTYDSETDYIRAIKAYDFSAADQQLLDIIAAFTCPSGSSRFLRN